MRARLWRGARFRRFLATFGVAVGLLLPRLLSNLYSMHLVNLTGITVIVVIGLNLVTGYAGQISIGHAAFYLIGAYTSAILSTRYKMPFLVCMSAAAAAASVAGYIVGRPTLKLKGAYLAMATIGIGEIVNLVCLNWTGLTGGALGLKGVPSPTLFGIEFGTEGRYYYIVLSTTVLMYWLYSRIVHSGIGRAFVAIRQNEVAAQVMGIDVARLKTLAFVISTCYAGIAGSLYAHLIGYVSPYGFGFNESVRFLCMVLAGGMGTELGPVLGAALLIVAREAFRAFDQYQLIVYGLLLVGTIIFMPKGIVGAYQSWRAKMAVSGRATSRAD